MALDVLLEEVRRHLCLSHVMRHGHGHSEQQENTMMLKKRFFIKYDKKKKNWKQNDNFILIFYDDEWIMITIFFLHLFTLHLACLLIIYIFRFIIQFEKTPRHQPTTTRRHKMGRKATWDLASLPRFHAEERSGAKFKLRKHLYKELKTWNELSGWTSYKHTYVASSYVRLMVNEWGAFND